MPGPIRTTGRALIVLSTLVATAGFGQERPGLSCNDPAFGSFVNLAPGSRVEFSGAVANPNGISAVTVNGTSVRAGRDGRFTAPVVTRAGQNHVELVATSRTGAELRRVCSFLVANRWSPAANLLADAAILRLDQGAIDDGDRSGVPNSIADVLHAALAGSLAGSLESALAAANPLKPNSCEFTGPAGVCVVRVGIDFVSLALGGPVALDAALVDGGISMNVVAEDVGVNLRVRGSVAGIGLDTTGLVRFDSVGSRAIFDLSLDGRGRPRVTARPGSLSVTVGNASHTFAGLDGVVTDAVVSVAEGPLRNLVGGIARDTASDRSSMLLNDLFSGVRIDGMPPSFQVPRATGSASVSMSSTSRVTNVSARSDGIRFGLGTSFLSTAAHNREPTSVALPSSGPAIDPVSGGAAAAGTAYAGILNQYLHALWRAGFFDETFSTDRSSMRLRTMLPPVVVLGTDRDVAIDVGAVEALVENVLIEFGSRVSATVLVDNDDLRLDGLRIVEAHTAARTGSLDPTRLATIERALRTDVLALVGAALVEGLPALPIAAFPVDTGLEFAGLPAGSSLGITEAEFVHLPGHLLLRGGFGVRGVIGEDVPTEGSGFPVRTRLP